MPAMIEHAKRCPFCGHSPKLELLGNPPSLPTLIRCSVCRCDLHWYDTEGDAIAAWNTRAESSNAYENLQRDNEALLEALKACYPLARDYGQPTTLEGVDCAYRRAEILAMARAVIAQAEAQLSSGQKGNTDATHS